MSVLCFWRKWLICEKLIKTVCFSHFRSFSVLQLFSFVCSFNYCLCQNNWAYNEGLKFENVFYSHEPYVILWFKMRWFRNDMHCGEACAVTAVKGQIRCTGEAGALEDRVRGSTDPPKIWSWGQKLHMALNSQHDFKGWGENKRIMLHDKTIFDLNPLVEKWFPFATPVEVAYRSAYRVEPYFYSHKRKWTNIVLEVCCNR